MSEYTPTTEQVRLDYVMAYSEKESSQILAERDFDRWLAEVERQVAEKVWDRCVGEMPIDPDWKIFYTDNNPYQRGAGQ